MAFLDLPAVEAAFADWRANKTPRQHIPEALKVQVIGLLAHYKAGLIRQRLGLSGSQIAVLKQQAKQQSDCQKPLNRNDPFVMATVAQLEDTKLSIEVTGAHNGSMRVELNSVQQLQQLLPNLMGLL